MMGYNVCPTVATGDSWSAANHNSYIRDNFAAGVPDIFQAAGDIAYAAAANVAGILPIGSPLQYFRTNTAGNAPEWATLLGSELCALRMDGISRTIANNASLSVLFDNASYEILDVLGWHDPSTNSDRVTVPAGTYLLLARVGISGNFVVPESDGGVHLFIAKDGETANLNAATMAADGYKPQPHMLNAMSIEKNTSAAYYSLVVVNENLGAGGQAILKSAQLFILKLT